ncbi:Septum site-determining protein MinD [Nocardioides dokdonensis FR1436]|uniref:Septum site-determining protein MinD n=1 Tax=Nocardioides dokdonensis FR1436 TaxID=1300347 RepID=A0A1A9GJZ6_9ACTN|nr:septum site-determining protein Ssd [Nocardioides dokdonensis]ANH38000.1 Septum site-determining protein MinD [Nocardioides dokdonensis FR1436]
MRSLRPVPDPSTATGAAGPDPGGAGTGPAGAAPLVVTRDPDLLDQVGRLAAAAGTSPAVTGEPAQALRRWTRAPLVLLGADLVGEMAVLGPPRRPRVHVVSTRVVPDDLFRLALAVGAADVSDLPASAGWLTELLTDLGEARVRPARVVGVVGGSGGAGATTLACALGQGAARRGTTLVVDTDPAGPGLDRVLGLEGVDGIRWDALGRTTGRLSARSLRDAVPRRNGLGVLTWAPGAVDLVAPFAAREALSAARRGHETVVVDLPRVLGPVPEEAVAHCDLILVVVVPTVPGLSSAARVCARLADPGRVRLVVRGGADAALVRRAVGAPVLAAMGDQRGLDEAVDLGLGPVRSHRGVLGRTAAGLLDRLELLGEAA